MRCLLLALSTVLLSAAPALAQSQAPADLVLDTFQSAPWQPLWDGKTLQGWHVIGKGTWTIEDGAIVGRHVANEAEFSHLVSDAAYRDFSVRLKYKAVKGNSGLYFRIEEKGFSGVTGFQAEIDASQDAGGLYETNGRAWVVQPKPEDVKNWFKPGEWNEMTVTALGTHVVVYVNGKKSAELLDDAKGRRAGKFALQVHGGQDCEVWFKDIEVQPWTDLLPGPRLDGWTKAGTGDWGLASEVALSPVSSMRLAYRPLETGRGTIINGSEGHTRNLVSDAGFGDVAAHVEFMIPKSSNSGVYFLGRYEVQVYDSHGVAKDKYPGIECGGIYPRWVDNKEVEGHSPRVNVSKPPGQWQSFDVLFRAPRFDAAGKKTANARFVKVIHNGVVVHENVEVTGPTRAAMFNDEKPTGPLMLQGDHGPVAYRNLMVLPLK